MLKVIHWHGQVTSLATQVGCFLATSARAPQMPLVEDGAVKAVSMMSAPSVKKPHLPILSAKRAIS